METLILIAIEIEKNKINSRNNDKVTRNLDKSNKYIKFIKFFFSIFILIIKITKSFKILASKTIKANNNYFIKFCDNNKTNKMVQTIINLSFNKIISLFIFIFKINFSTKLLKNFLIKVKIKNNKIENNNSTNKANKINNKFD